jgi:hypothetical protein
LGERLLCKQEVIGSIPFSSTRRLGFRLPVVLLRRSEIGRPGWAGRCCLTLWIGCVPAWAGSLAASLRVLRALSPGSDEKKC